METKKRPLNLDWDTLIPSQEEEPPVVVIVKPTATTTISEPQTHSDMDTDQQYSQTEAIEHFSDHKLEESIRSKRNTLLTTAMNLPDKGEKLRAALKRLEDELERRKLKQVRKEADGCEKPTQVKSSSTIGDNSFRQETVASQDHTQSSFSACFYEKMGDTDYRMVDAFDKELSLIKRCDHQKMRHNGEFSRKERKKDSTSSRQLPFQCPSSISEHDLSNGDQRRRANSSFPQHQNEKLSSSCAQMRKNASRVTQSNDSVSRKGETIVLEDEDESHFPERTEQADKLAERMQEARIYYPSRDDPESVELCYMDIDCLAPEGFLTSTIMNFYIRYLQQQASVTDTSISDYHFFNTYFYKKLKEAVSYKGNDRGTFFMKFRRWWKGVNIFEKAYVLIPIHEDLHWSLVIICIPDKEEESGSIILHLDSLGLHSSKSVFDNIRSYMREEWNYLNQEVDSSDIPIAERIWKHLPRRIDDKIIKVPQQKNDYDCGLFVLFFIQRFMEEAPERLKKNDLSMFGKQWFKPQEASGLRGKIRKLLLQEFQNACEVNSLSDASTQEDS